MKNTQSTLGCKFYIIRILTTMRIFNKEKYIRLFTLTLLMIKGLIMANAANSAPFYGVDVDLHNVGVDIRINDIPVYFDYSKGQLTVELPSPDAIINDENNLSLSIFLPFDEQSGDQTLTYEKGAYATATLFQQDLKMKDSEKIKLSTVTIKVTDNGVLATTEDYVNNNKASPKIILTEDNTSSVSVNTTISSPFPRWAWQDGNIIENSQENYESLLVEYKKIHTALSEKSLTKLKTFYSERAKEIAIAYHLKNQAAGYKKLSVGEDMNDKSIELNDLFVDNMHLQILGNGKLARIRNELNAQPIFYYDANAELFHLYKFTFYCNKDDQWVMIR